MSPNEYYIDRGVVDKILENQADLMRQARIVPEQENGRVVGIASVTVEHGRVTEVFSIANPDKLGRLDREHALGR